MQLVQPVQRVQPVRRILWAGLLLGELLTALTAVGAVAVGACAALAIRSRVRR